MQKYTSWTTPVNRKFLSGGTRDAVGVSKLVAKIPMTNRVIDDENTLWEYHITCGVIIFVKIAQVIKED